MSFSALNIHEDGSGDYRINRFRSYFRIPDGTARFGDRDALGGGLFDRFVETFNPNIATLEEKSQTWRERPTLSFRLEARLFGHGSKLADYLAPDLHTDWVGVQTLDRAKGFTVQTLNRNFTTGDDQAAGAAAFAMALPAGVPAAIAARSLAIDLNQRHFLAGRRAWIVKPARFFASTNPAGVPDDAYVIETAAIERLSSLGVRIVAASGATGNFAEQVREIWLRFLANYVSKNGLEAVPVTALAAQSGAVSYQEEHFGSRSECQASPIFSDLTAKYDQLYPQTAHG